MKGNKGLVVIFSLLCSLLFVFSAEAGSQSELLAKIRQKDSGGVIASYYEDFDGNGSKEIFAVMGQGQPTRLWFASDKQVVRCETSATIYSRAVAKVSSKQNLFIAECTAGGSGSTTYCFYVKKGKVKKVSKAGPGLTHIKGKQFYIMASDFDHYLNGKSHEGHTHKRYYVKWTGKGFQFYGFTPLTEAKLKKYKGASAILKKARKEGYSIGTIFKRDNGIINVNLYRKYTYGLEYENLTLKISGKKVKLQIIWPTSSTWISQVSFGGVYYGEPRY